MKKVSRSKWGARPARSAASYLGGTRGVKVHYTGSPESVGLLDHHERCDDRVRSIQDSHMDGNGWSDLGYSAVVCAHGHVYVGRGPHALPAANGPGLNSGHYAVCGLVGSKGFTEPTPAMLHGIRDAIEWLRREGNAGNEIKGHRDGYSTSCPGGPLYAWVKKGAPRPGGSSDDWMEAMVKKLPTLGIGDQGEHVETVQALCIARSHPEVKVSGKFDSVTAKAVMALQRWGKVDDDGIVGPDTWPVLLRVH